MQYQQKFIFIYLCIISDTSLFSQFVCWQKTGNCALKTKNWTEKGNIGIRTLVLALIQGLQILFWFSFSVTCFVMLTASFQWQFSFCSDSISCFWHGVEGSEGRGQREDDSHLICIVRREYPSSWTRGPLQSLTKWHI